MEPIVVQFNKTKVYAIFLCCILAEIAVIWSLSHPFSGAHGLLRTMVLRWGLGPLGAYSGLVAGLQLLSNYPALSIDNKGITDSASGLSAGFIPWSNFAGAGLVGFGLLGKKTYIGIALVDRASLLDGIFWPKKFFMLVNYYLCGYVVLIPQTTLAQPLENLLSDMLRFHNSFRGLPAT